MTAARINLAALRQGMDREGVDVLLAVSQENFFYLTDTLLLSQKMLPARLCIAVLPRDGAPSAVVCYCEELQTRQDSWITDIRTYLEFQESPLRAVADHLTARGFAAARIGIEERFLAAAYAQELAGLLPDASLVGADHLFDEARAIKTPAEIELMAAAARRTERAILASLQTAAPGDTEQEMATGLSTRVLSAGATWHWLTLAAGSNTAINHPYPGSKRLTAGEIVRIDLTANFGGYQADVARTAAIAAAGDERRSTYRRLRDAQRETIAAARPGSRACDLYLGCKRALARSGLAITSQSVGHGFGIGMHEFPVLHAYERAEIEPGMVLNIEPAAKDADGFLYHTEDTLVVTDGEPRILTDLMDTDELFVIG